mmetsp:Transcript_72360/g.170209  ORF Transcript_72360/g.170209 Transcript_72360/m.170209 type:complete len:118 (+) Transcript_72360:204-557(+)|eukprot:CAMPEP_0175860570 /NCGR_PEP_ID=MMETSP0107_2-20121207/30888_1 /TAXON_ID=195067 ORGANISM="Goniomonas pacifica, Strain CCMP1869" /NCGR_SAMPLE_ID=MMETSP0107_2 /ASSEMBLY_ACC=CAM_ASM_000203 /LENGTH=117 /DNA_ID=CAMNT_0017177323 /DNA_START=178 /DNA_END=531 /DNA_ORIENTATION=+
MSTLVDQLQESGLEILAFPCNQFLSQEPGTNEEVATRVKERFGFPRAGFTLFEKVDVNGPNTHDVYRFLRSTPGMEEKIEWNFGKFIVAPDGKVLSRHNPKTNPASLESEIRSALQA